MSRYTTLASLLVLGCAAAQPLTMEQVLPQTHAPETYEYRRMAEGISGRYPSRMILQNSPHPEFLILGYIHESGEHYLDGKISSEVSTRTGDYSVDSGKTSLGEFEIFTKGGSHTHICIELDGPLPNGAQFVRIQYGRSTNYEHSYGDPRQTIANVSLDFLHDVCYGDTLPELSRDEQHLLAESFAWFVKEELTRQEK